MHHERMKDFVPAKYPAAPFLGGDIFFDCHGKIGH